MLQLKPSDPYEKFDFTVLECPTELTNDASLSSDDDVLEMEPTNYVNTTER